MGKHWIGTSGWSYPQWRSTFYPPGTKQGDWLRYYAAHLSSVEINATFYRLPRESLLQSWLEKTPPGFLFAVKAWRALTHYHRLSPDDALLARFFDSIGALGPKRGPILFQLPPRFPCDREVLAAFLAHLPRGHRFVFEFRDPSWHDDAVYTLLAERNAAFCPFELAAERGPRIVTADFVYVRLHGREARYVGRYDDAALSDWARWIAAQKAAGRDAYVYFDNTIRADDAVANAIRLAALLATPDSLGAESPNHPD